MKQKYLLLTMILFVFLFLFFTPSLALIPGDFGSGGGGPPDGVVNFEDLMIFAMAYGTTPADANWNEVCDIAGLGSTTPDGVIDFEDLMIFAMHYGERERVTWTVMVYLDGDNTLDYYAWDDLSEMESIGSSNEINIITQVDLYNSCSGTYRYFVTGAEQGSIYPLYPNDIVQTLPEQNMADPAVLNNFINWSINNYPADHYILILWDHGGGWREENIFTKGIIVDDTSNDFLTMAELVQGLENIEEPLDIIGFDACLMQMAEVYYEIGSSITTTSPPAYGIGSEESEWGDGWPYDLILADLINNPSMSESTLCETIVNDYISYCGSVGTLSALYFSPEITQSTEAVNAINSFAIALMNSAYQTEINLARSSAQSYSSADYKDFYDFAQIIKNSVLDCQSEAQTIMDLITTVVISEAHTGFSVDNSHGLSIYLPDSSGNYDSDYDTLLFAIDTQWDEFLKSGPNVVSDIEARAITYQGTSMEMFQAKMDKLVEEELIPDSFHLNELTPTTKGVIEHVIDVGWHSYPDATGYRVYRSVNGGSYSMVLEEPASGYTWYGFWDYDVSEGSTYAYYITAYGSGWETNPSQTVTIDTWLPPCSLISPTDESIITDPTPTFTWNPVGLTSSDFPYGSIASGNSDLYVYDYTGGEIAWWPFFYNDMTTSSITYNNDGQALPLQSGHAYYWESWGYGYDDSGHLIAMSWSEGWDFYYGNIVADVDADAVTYQGTSMEIFQAKMDKLIDEELIPDSFLLNELPSLTKGVTLHAIYVDWHSYPDATGYKVYRSVNGGSFSLIFQDEPTTSYTYYGFYDYDVSEGSSYAYYVTAYGSGWETDPSQTVTIDTWLPPCSLLSPTDESIITNPTPTFAWNPVGLTPADFPYGSIVSGYSWLNIWEHTNWDRVWDSYFNNLTTSSATYNQDGQATPLAAGNGYEWQIDSYGFDENGKLIAYSWSEYWDFYYGNIVADVDAYAITEQGISMEMFQAKMDKLVEEELIPDSLLLNELPPLTKGVTEHAIYVDWHSYPDATGYKVFRSVNGGSYSLKFQYEPTTGYNWYGFWDYDVLESNSYSYYVTAYGSGWETDPSQTVTVDTWLPPCSLISPTDQSIITNPTPTFTWNPVGALSFPYGSIYSGRSNLDVIEYTTWDWVWNPYFDDLTTSSATYNQDGQATPLIAGNGYEWQIDSFGYDENGKLIAYSWSEYWEFVYSGGANAGVTEVEAVAETYVSESMMMQYLTEIQTDWPGEGYIFNEPEPAKTEVNHNIWIMWKGFCEASGYGFKIYRSIDGGYFEVIFSGTVPIGYSWYGFTDNTVGPDSSYKYYVTAYSSDWESEPSSEVTIDTWLPPCSLISPTDGSLISNPNPAFDWDPVITDFPYGSLVFGRTCMLVYDDTISDFTWIVCTGDPNISTATYNQDGGALPLVNGHNYSWHCWNSGYDENWNRIAVSESIDWHFDYTGP
jgi:hypothetical protein